jgi:hypothetical protein
MDKRRSVDPSFMTTPASPSGLIGNLGGSEDIHDLCDSSPSPRLKKNKMMNTIKTHIKKGYLKNYSIQSDVIERLKSNHELRSRSI